MREDHPRAIPWSEIDDLPVGERYAPVHAGGEFMIVGGNQRREARLAHQRLQRVEYIMRGLRIEIAGRLVGEQQERRVGDGAGNGDTLLFTAGEFGRTVFTAMPHAHIVEQRAGALRASAWVRPAMSCGIITFSTAENSGRR